MHHHIELILGRRSTSTMAAMAVVSLRHSEHWRCPWVPTFCHCSLASVSVATTSAPTMAAASAATAPASVPPGPVTTAQQQVDDPRAFNLAAAHRGAGIRRFLRNPWEAKLAPMLGPPADAGELPDWYAHLETVGAVAGALKITYTEGEELNQSGRSRRHSA